MDVADLSENWADWIPALQGAFPRAALPDTCPRADTADALIRHIAAAHDLTPAEVRDMIEDLVLHGIAQAAACEAA